MLRHPSQILLALFSALLLMGAGCVEDTPPATPSAPAAMPATPNPGGPDERDSEWPRMSVQQRLRGSYFSDADGGPPSTEWFFPVFEKGLFESAGQVDTSNRYASTVIVEVDDSRIEENCSGVLLAPRLALTAGHCVCMKRQAVSPQKQAGWLLDASACAQRANVTTVLYESGEDPRRPDMRFRSYKGRILPHPEFSLVLDSRESVVSNQADLAVILLDEPVKSRVPYFPVADVEAQPHESLVMTGYGHDKHLGGIHGMRYFRRNTVTRGQPGGRILYEQQGAYVFDGFSGGPCLREQGKDRWLAGIASVGSNQELSFTSTYFYRAWLRSELQRADRSPLRPSSP